MDDLILINYIKLAKCSLTLISDITEQSTVVFW